MRPSCQIYRRKNRLAWPVILFLSALVLLAFIAERQLAPIILTAAEMQTEQRAQRILFNSARDVLLEQKDGGYNDLIELSLNEAGEIIFLEPQTAKINLLISNISLRAEEGITALSQEKINLPLGALTGSALLSEFGPLLQLSARSIGKVQVELQEEFSSAGVNQTRHKIYLQMTAQMQLIVPFSSRRFTAQNCILLTEGVIVGNVPYLYLQNSSGLE